MNRIQGGYHERPRPCDGAPPAPHVMPPALLVRIARGGGGDALAFLSKTQRSKSVLLARAVADATAGQQHPQTMSVRQAYRGLRAASARSPEAVLSVLTYPSVCNWAMHTLTRLDDPRGPAAEPGRLALVTLAAALRSGTDVSIALGPDDLDPLGLPLPSLGLLRLDDVTEGADVRIDHATATVSVNGRRFDIGPGARISSPAWRALDRVQVGSGPWRWDLSVDDPHSLCPPAEALIPRDSSAAWATRLSAGWARLTSHHAADAQDVQAAVRTLCPLPDVESGHVSGTFRHASGCLAISLPTDPQSTAVTFVHELQHLKLSATMDLFELVDMSSGDRRYVPWREDPRPPSGLLHGAYAHLGVAGFWRTEARVEADPGYRDGAQTQYVRWRQATEQVCVELLGSTLLTPIGRRFVNAMMDRLASWSKDRIPRAVLTHAARLNAEHRIHHTGGQPRPRRT